MAKFETTGQVVTLFLGAAVVAVLCIVFLTAEAHKREMVKGEDEDRAEENTEMGTFQGVLHSLTSFFGSDPDEGQERRLKRETDEYDTKENEVKRYKRDTGDDMLDDFVFGDRNQYKVNNENNEDSKNEIIEIVDENIHTEMVEVSPDIDEALLSEASSHHKIRHIEDKVSHLSANHQLVAAVLDRFCIITPCPGLQSLHCPACPPANCSKCEDSTVINNSSSHIPTSMGVNKTSGCPIVSCPTDHMNHQFPHTYTHQHPQLRQQTIPSSAIVCSTNTEVIVIILLTTFTNFIVFTILLFCLKARQNFKEELMENEEETLDDHQVNEEDNATQCFDANRFKSQPRRYSLSDVGYSQTPKYTVLEEYGFVV